MRFLKYLIIGLGVFIILHIVVSAGIGLHDVVEPTDLIVVFGNTVNPDGTLSARLASRLDAAQVLFDNGYGRYILVSGGLGKEGYDEAKAMAEYLMRHHIPQDYILQDSQGLNTRATIQNTKSIMQEKNLHSVIAVSQYHHIPRILLAFKQAGINNVYHVHAEIRELRDGYAIIREFFAFYNYLIL
jgi:vancomycin permeability regulator SanA